MTTKEKAVIMAYTGICMLCYDELTYFYKYVDDILGFPIMSHEIPYFANEIKEASKPDFISLCINGYVKEDKNNDKRRKSHSPANSKKEKNSK